ncbi:hypothetical protein M885DRAFT_586733 [Pelagophyceae sp. CCMP2097]|nr:hypothetical protein M885DRAFT_586733 [Pelagophyceae sp. CCMP2097]
MDAFGRRKSLDGEAVVLLLGLEPPAAAYALDASGKGFSEILDLSTVPRARTLDVSGNVLRDLRGVGGARQLRELKAGSNRLTCAEDVADCPHVEALWLQDNQLTEAPHCLAKLLRLRALRLDRNRLTGWVGPGLSACASLQVLDLSGNALTSLAGLATLASLTELDVSRNELTGVPAGALDAARASLRELRLGDNCIGDVCIGDVCVPDVGPAAPAAGAAEAPPPGAARGIARRPAAAAAASKPSGKLALRLALQRTAQAAPGGPDAGAVKARKRPPGALHTALEGLRGMSNLRVLGLARNHLTQISAALPGALASLVELDVRENRIISLGALHLVVPKLDVLNAGKNRLDDIAAVINSLAQLGDLVELHLVGNPCATATAVALLSPRPGSARPGTAGAQPGSARPGTAGARPGSARPGTAGGRRPGTANGDRPPTRGGERRPCTAADGAPGWAICCARVPASGILVGNPRPRALTTLEVLDDLSVVQPERLAAAAAAAASAGDDALAAPSFVDAPPPPPAMRALPLRHSKGLEKLEPLEDAEARAAAFRARLFGVRSTLRTMETRELELMATSPAAMPPPERAGSGRPRHFPTAAPADAEATLGTKLNVLERALRFGGDRAQRTAPAADGAPPRTATPPDAAPEHASPPRAPDREPAPLEQLALDDEDARDRRDNDSPPSPTDRRQDDEDSSDSELDDDDAAIARRFNIVRAKKIPQSPPGAPPSEASAPPLEVAAPTDDQGRATPDAPSDDDAPVVAADGAYHAAMTEYSAMMSAMRGSDAGASTAHDEEEDGDDSNRNNRRHSARTFERPPRNQPDGARFRRVGPVSRFRVPPAPMSIYVVGPEADDFMAAVEKQIKGLPPAPKRFYLKDDPNRKEHSTRGCFLDALYSPERIEARLADAFFEGDAAYMRDHVHDLPEDCLEEFLATYAVEAGPRADRKYKVIFYGMSGYTGSLVMEYLKRECRDEVVGEIAFAGRSLDKVIAARDRVLAGTKWADTPCLGCSLDDPRGTAFDVERLVSSTRVVANIAGPFMLTGGERLVEACISYDTDYCDVSGEVPYSAKLNEYHDLAREAGVYIVPSAAFAGGMPDIGTFLVAAKIRELYGEETRSVHGYVQSKSNGSVAPSGGTLQTRAAMAAGDKHVRDLLMNPFALGGMIEDGQREEDQDKVLTKIWRDPLVNKWCAPHAYAFFETRVVRRSNWLHNQVVGGPGCGDWYGCGFNVTMYAMVSSEAEAKALKAGSGSAAAEEAKLKKEGKYYGAGEGPPFDELIAAECSMVYHFVGVAESGRKVNLSFCGRDGYYETARVITETALMMAVNGASLRSGKDNKVRGGVLTPAIAGRHVLPARLRASGMGFVDWTDSGKIPDIAASHESWDMPPPFRVDNE